MYAGLAGTDLALTTTLLPIWLTAALLAGHVATRRTGRRVRRTARIAVGFVALGLLLVIGRVIAVGGLASFGWIFVVDRKLITLLVVLIPALATPVAAVRLLRVVRKVDDEVPAQLRAAAAAPAIVLPIQVTAFASLAGFNEGYLPPVGYRAAKVLLLAGAVAVVAVLLVFRARHRSARLAAPGARLRATGRIWLLRTGVTVALLALISGLFVVGMAASKNPETFSMMNGTPDYGGGEPLPHAHIAGRHGSSVDTGAASVTELRGPRDGTPDRTFTLTAQEASVRLASGATVSAWTFNGQVPGPELRVKQGELVEINLVNRLPKEPVTIHWHGLDVPNGEDGVAGVTQDAVAPGQSFTYRFRVDEVGTRWYHSHQAASEQVIRGLFGPLVIEPATGPVADQDIPVVLHDWKTDRGERHAFGQSDVLERKQIAAGSNVRLRLVNSGNKTRTVTLTGAPYRVVALDGTDLNAPGELRDNRLVIGSASRVDVELTMPAGPVRLADTDAADAGLLLSPDGKGDLAAKTDGPEFDPTSYGKPAPAPFDANSRYDRKFELIFDEQFGFYNGQFTARMTVNGKTFPDAPMHMVRQGELIRMRFVHRGDEDHPIHLHGHHFLVLSRNGTALTGSPVWLDTVNVKAGEIWEIGFRADNPGVWMDHCHNFEHTKRGFVLHLAYENVTTPFQVGGAVGNHPD